MLCAMNASVHPPLHLQGMRSFRHTRWNPDPCFLGIMSTRQPCMHGPGRTTKLKWSDEDAVEGLREGILSR